MLQLKNHECFTSIFLTYNVEKMSVHWSQFLTILRPTSRNKLIITRWNNYRTQVNKCVTKHNNCHINNYVVGGLLCFSQTINIVTAKQINFFVIYLQHLQISVCLHRSFYDTNVIVYCDQILFTPVHLQLWQNNWIWKYLNANFGKYHERLSIHLKKKYFKYCISDHKSLLFKYRTSTVRAGDARESLAAPSPIRKFGFLRVLRFPLPIKLTATK